VSEGLGHQLPLLCCEGLWGPCTGSSRVKRPVPEAGHWLRSNAGVSVWSYTSTSQRIFMAWCLIKNTDDLTVYFQTWADSKREPVCVPLNSSAEWQKASRWPSMPAVTSSHHVDVVQSPSMYLPIHSIHDDRCGPVCHVRCSSVLFLFVLYGG
jgi:hypothetical protein